MKRNGSYNTFAKIDREQTWLLCGGAAFVIFVRFVVKKLPPISADVA